MFAIARGAAPGAWRRLRTCVLFAPLCILLLAGCRTVGDDRHWGHHHHRHHGHYHAHRPAYVPPAYRPLPSPSFRHWHREPHSGDHGRHRHGGHHHRRGR